MLGINALFKGVHVQAPAHVMKGPHRSFSFLGVCAAPGARPRSARSFSIAAAASLSSAMAPAALDSHRSRGRSHPLKLGNATMSTTALLCAHTYKHTFL